MAIATGRPTLNGRRSPAPSAPALKRPQLGARRRQLPLVVAGVVLVLGCALGFALTSIHLAGGASVLEVVRSVPAGAPITSNDLSVVRVTLPPGDRTLGASAESGLVGQPAAVALVPGALLVAGEVGQAPNVAAGYSIDVVPVPGANGTPSGANVPTAPIRATVLAVDVSPTSSQDAVVVTLQVARSSADGVAVLGALGTGSIVVLPSSGSGR